MAFRVLATALVAALAIAAPVANPAGILPMSLGLPQTKHLWVWN